MEEYEVNIAEAWSQAFVARNTELFFSRTAQSLTYVGMKLSLRCKGT